MPLSNRELEAASRVGRAKFRDERHVSHFVASRSLERVRPLRLPRERREHRDMDEERKPRRWSRWIAGAIVVGYGMAGGCFAQRLPPAPSAGEAATLRQPPLPYAVAVMPWDAATAAKRGQNPQAYGDAAYRWLKGSGAFSSVQSTPSDLLGVDLIASSTGAYCNSAVIPLFTLLSLGVIPTLFTDHDCEGIVFRPNDANRTDSVALSYDQEGRVIMGWLALPIGFLPGWTHGSALEHPRSRDRARLAVLAHRTALAALASR
jgi:hypothetical protein